MKLSKQQSKLHRQAMALVRSDEPLSLEERRFVLENFHEGAEHMQGVSGAFFTPPGLARDFAIEVHGKRVLDLCAGIGSLSYACDDGETEFACVERNPAYVEVGRRILPKATWIEADVFDVDAYAHLGPFDCVIANPPFGKIPADGFKGRYTGGQFEFRLIELASTLARSGVFLLPQMSTPFRYSGQQCYEEHDRSTKYERFREQTGIAFEFNCGIDTSSYRGEWKSTSPICEIVCCDFEEVVASDETNPEGQLDMFSEAG